MIKAGIFLNNGTFLVEKDVIVDKTNSTYNNKNGISLNIRASTLSNNYFVICASRFD
jgi:hypothetical protein